VTEVLLYDRLVIPRPATPEEEGTNKKGEDGQTEELRWAKKGWNPKRLRTFLDVLGDLAIELPWTRTAQHDWSELSTKPHAAQREDKRSELVQSLEQQIDQAKGSSDYPYFVTGGALALYVAGAMHNPLAKKLMALARTPGVAVEPVIAYRSFRDFEQSHGAQQGPSGTATSGESPYAMFGWEFFAPEGTEKDDYRLLRDAAKLASRSDFKETRQSFHGWLKQMYDGGVDVETARNKMLKMLDEYRKFVRGSFTRTAVRFVAKAAVVAAPLAALHQKEIGAIASAAAGGASLFIDQFLPRRAPVERIRPAVFVHDAKRFFGK
jgi:hypothetical protein